MRKIGILGFLVLFFAGGFTLTAQQREISLEEIWNGSFRTEGLDALRSLKNGKEYSVLNYQRDSRSSTIDVFDYNSGNKLRTVLNTANLQGVSGISSYEFSKDEKKVLFSTELQGIFRRSTRGKFYVYDIASAKLTPVSDKLIQEPTFSNDGTKVAFAFENNLYIKDLNTGAETQITRDGRKNHIINGITDWVYEEEFGFVRAFEWSPNGDKIAFIRFDETDVPEFQMDIYGKQLYPTQEVFKYPKAGENNSKVSLHIYDLASSKLSGVDLSAYNNYYIPRLLWTNDNNLLSVQLMNRHQNELDFVFVNASDLSSKRIFRETDAAYVDITDDLYFNKDNSFFWTSEKDGWNHLYHYDKNGKLIRQVTRGPWEITRFYGYDEKTERIFYQSTEDGNINRNVYSILANGKGKTRLTKQDGINNAAFSADFTYFINTFSNTQTPFRYTLNDSKSGRELREIKNNNALKSKLASYKISPKEFSTIHVNGEDLNMYMIKPLDFNPNKKYPVFMYQYSGPGSQNVRNSWLDSNDYWHQMLAQQGYIIVCVDGRGTGYKGAAFKKMTQLQLGKYEVQDQTAVAQKLGKESYVDPARIGIWGWSYGGFMSSNSLFQSPDTFKMAIAVAPVTSWRFYDSIYTERYMKTPQENPSGYDDNSPLTHVNKMKGRLLLVHGSADDNVHVQNAMRLVENLVQANKDFDWRIYPDKDHGIYGGNTRLHLYRLMTNYIKDNL